MATPLDRRRFLAAAGLTATGTALAPSLVRPLAGAVSADAPADWAWVRDQFDAARDYSHFASFFIASNPRPVREAIDALRRAIDANPYFAIDDDLFTGPARVRAAAAAFVGGAPEEIALTRCTTEGLALVYNGLSLAPGQEIVCTTHDHYSHHESIRLARRRSGASERRIALYEDPAAASEDEIVDRVRKAIGPRTRAVGVTWVHSSTGVKLPIRRIADAVAEVNQSRGPAERALLIVDGVHGFGVEEEKIATLGADFFAAGAHKWIFGPRGTGILWGRRDAWAQAQPTVPSFEVGPYEAWMESKDPGATEASWMSPGGFHAYEHIWALPAAFAFHERIGRGRIAARIHELNTRIKDGLADSRGIRLLTPRSDRLSAGLVGFEVGGKTPEEVVKRLRARRIVASTSPYKPSVARLAGSLLNTPEEVDAAVRAVREIATT